METLDEVVLGPRRQPVADLTMTGSFTMWLRLWFDGLDISSTRLKITLMAITTSNHEGAGGVPRHRRRQADGEDLKVIERPARLRRLMSTTEAPVARTEAQDCTSLGESRIPRGGRPRLPGPAAASPAPSGPRSRSDRALAERQIAWVAACPGGDVGPGGQFFQAYGACRPRGTHAARARRGCRHRSPRRWPSVSQQDQERSRFGAVAAVQAYPVRLEAAGAAA